MIFVVLQDSSIQPLGERKKMEGVSTSITQYQYRLSGTFALDMGCQLSRSTYEIQIKVNTKVIAYLLCNNITQSLSRYQPEPK